MKVEHARKWADALYFGNHKKFTHGMGNGDLNEKPTEMCCLGVLNETIKPNDYKKDRSKGYPERARISDIINQCCPSVFGELFSALNDGTSFDYGEMSHKEIAFLIDLAVETGEIENV